MTVVVATRYLSVLTYRPAEVTAYLYAGQHIIDTVPGTATGGSTGLIVEVSAAPASVDFRARYIADRLASGLHGTVVHNTEADARDRLTDILD